ncbi:hypothetical protein ACFL20_08025 [Spirochaetota bacterium]
MDKNNSFLFEMASDLLLFDPAKWNLLCKDKVNKKIRWAKKIDDINNIANVIEDSNNYYMVCESTETNGRFLAIKKRDGSTLWYIPGKSFLQQLFGGYLYNIFADENSRYFLLKVDKTRGDKIWFHQVDIDLDEYSFKKDSIMLKYQSGKIENISHQTGRVID